MYSLLDGKNTTTHSYRVWESLARRWATVWRRIPRRERSRSHKNEALWWSYDDQSRSKDVTGSWPAFLAVRCTSRHWRRRCRRERPEWPQLSVQALVKHKDTTAHTLHEQHYTFQNSPIPDVQLFTPLLSTYIHLPRKLSLRFFLSRPFKLLQWCKERIERLICC